MADTIPSYTEIYALFARFPRVAERCVGRAPDADFPGRTFRAADPDAWISLGLATDAGKAPIGGRMVRLTDFAVETADAWAHADSLVRPWDRV